MEEAVEEFRMEVMEELSDVDLKVKEFDGMVREVVILCLISIVLYVGSFALLGLLRCSTPPPLSSSLTPPPPSSPTPPPQEGEG